MEPNSRIELELPLYQSGVITIILSGLMVEFGAHGRNQTDDILVTSEVLYQLSYTGLLEQVDRIKLS